MACSRAERTRPTSGLRARSPSRGAGSRRAAAARAFAALAVLATISGCGVYSTRPGKIPGHIKSVAIPIFENRTTQAELDDEITQAIVNRFVADNNLRVVGEAEADAILSGAVLRYDNAVFGFTGNVQAEEYRVSIIVDCRFFDKVKNREMWRDEGLTKTANYYVVEVPGQPAKTEIDGRQEAIQKIADEVLSRIVDAW